METAYFGGNIGNAFSTLFYTISYLVFLEVVFSNVKTIAGYSRNEILFLSFIGQVNFYLVYFLFVNNTKQFIRDVNQGNLDLVLSKPLPHLFYITFHRLRVISILRDGAPTLIILGLLVKWSELSIGITSIFPAICILLAGVFAYGAFLFLFALPVFWKGESESMYLISYAFIDSSIPWEGFKKPLQIIFFGIIPALIMSQVSASVMLQKQDFLLPLIFSICTAIVFTIIKILGWKLALRQYSSASS